MADTITITGNLADEPEQRTISPGVVVTNFRVGSTHRRLDRSTDRWVDSYTSWYSVSAYRALGENAFASLHKGERVIVTGRLRVRDWDNGTKRGTAVEIEADAVGHDLLWGVTAFRRGGSGGTDASRDSAANPGAQAAQNTAGGPDAPTDAGGWALPPSESGDSESRESGRVEADTPF